MAGVAYIYLRRHGANNLGHVGWGYTFPGGKPAWGRCGSTENGSGWPIRWGGTSGFWTEQVDNVPDMNGQMDYPPPFTGQRAAYGEYKTLDVDAPQVARAEAMLGWLRSVPYSVSASNCMNHAHWILGAYGATLPDPIMNWTPNAWFDVIDANSDVFY